MLTLQQLNQADRDTFVGLLAGVYEHSPWIAEAAFGRRPEAGFATLAQFKRALVEVVRAAPEAQAVAQPWQLDNRNVPLVQAPQRHGQVVFGGPIPTPGMPLFTDVWLFGAHGIPAAIYDAGPRTVLESHAKRADEHLVLSDLQGATRVVARSLLDLLA